MSRSTFTFNGHVSSSYDLTIERLPESIHAVRRGEIYQVAGRNGDYVREDGTFDNYVAAYQVWLNASRYSNGVPQQARDIAEWLLGSSGYCRLEDTFEPNIYRLARYAGPFNVEHVIQQFGRATIEFDCRPERFLTGGEIAVTLFENVDLSDASAVLAATATINNSRPFPAHPLFRITGIGNVGFTAENSVNGEVMDIRLNLGSGATATIDCDTYKISIAPELVSFGTTYPLLATLYPGNNIIAAASGLTNPGTITKLEVVPRWWTV